MGRLLTICSLILLLQLSVTAADWPAAELSVGPSFMRISGEDLLGGQVAFAVNRWEHFGFVGTFGYHQGNEKTHGLAAAPRPPGRCDDDNGHSSDHDRDNDNACPPRPPAFVTTGIGDVYTYLGGMRFRQELTKRLSIFAQGQAGGVRIGERNGLALAAGAGAQIMISQRFAIEARAENLTTRIAGAWSGRNLQATIGVVVRFGPWWGGFQKP